MKIMHTSDWHIGKVVNEFSMIEDQKYMLNKIIDKIEQTNTEVLIIAGDIYDRSLPPTEAVELLNETLSTLVLDKKIKVVAISGNHDSGERLAFASTILEKQGLYIAGRDDELFKKVSIKSELSKDEVDFYLVPYKDPSLVRKILDNKEIKTHNDAMKETINEINKVKDNDNINILVGHGYVTGKLEEAIEDIVHKYDIAGLETSESERPLSIGGTDLIDTNIFKDFDYVALGHLHGRQRVGSENIRYSGSLLKYSFSEENHKKGVVLLETLDNKISEINNIELKPLRDMRTVKGTMEEILEKGRLEGSEREDYIQAIVTDEGELLNPMEKLRSVYKNTMLKRSEVRESDREDGKSASEGYKTKSELELFGEFYKEYGNFDYTSEKIEVIKDVIDEVLRKDEE